MVFKIEKLRGKDLILNAVTYRKDAYKKKKFF
jgi:hypothetical protein